jgi:hypothetical protein
MKRERSLPIHPTAENRDRGREKRKHCRGDGDRHRETHYPLCTAGIDEREKEHDARRE